MFQGASRTGSVPQTQLLTLHLQYHELLTKTLVKTTEQVIYRQELHLAVGALLFPRVVNKCGFPPVISVIPHLVATRGRAVYRIDSEEQAGRQL